MTLDNSKRLFQHYVAIGNEEAATELAKKHPELVKKEEKPKEEKVKKSK